VSAPGKPLTLEEYLVELERKKDDRPEQVQDGIEIYVGMWKKVIGKGVVAPSDDLETALKKLDDAGGLYAASEE